MYYLIMYYLFEKLKSNCVAKIQLFLILCKLFAHNKKKYYLCGVHKVETKNNHCI